MGIWLISWVVGGCSRAEPPTPVPVAAPAPTAQAVADPLPGRVVAVGDLHADLDNALAVLRLAGVVDTDGRWSGGDTVFVQTGDTTDRGPDSRDVLALMRRLQAEAPAAGGRVVPLIGNHEAMNLGGDWRYVHPGDLERYGGVDSRKQAFSADGEDGRWLASLDVVAMVGDTVFTHGGVAPHWAALGVTQLNARAREALAAGSRDAVLGDEGPLWYRGFVSDPEGAACPRLAESLAALGARRMVVGHTTRRDGRIEARCGGALLVIDIGIADHYGAHYGAVEIMAGDSRALYPDGPVDLPDP